MSDVLHELPTFEQQVEDFRTVMDAAGSERAALIGTIDAGTLALASAAQHPERTSAVVAFESAPRYIPSPEDDFGVDPEMLGRMAAASEACVRSAGEAVRAIGLEIRAGVHTSEVELSDDDVQGIAVQIGARISPADKVFVPPQSGTWSRAPASRSSTEGSIS